MTAGKRALYLVHADVDPALLDSWNTFHAREHVPLVVRAAGFASAERYRHAGPDGTLLTDPPRFTIAYRAAGLGVVRSYLEGGEVGRMRAHHDAWIAKNAGDRRVTLSRDVLEENYSVDPGGDAVARAIFVISARIEADTVAAWSAWYDRDHMPAVVKAGAFLRGSRWRVVDDAVGAVKFAILYEASTLEAVTAFRSTHGKRFGEEHAKAFGEKVALERVTWTQAG